MRKVTEVRYDDVLVWVDWMTGRGAGPTAIYARGTSCLRSRCTRCWHGEPGALLPYGNPVPPGHREEATASSGSTN